VEKGNFRKDSIKVTLTLTGLMVGFWSFFAGLLQGLFGFVDSATFNASTALSPLPTLFLVCLLNSVIVVWYVKRTQFSGKELFLRIFIIIFGVMFFMTQVETVYFNGAIKMPWQIIFSTVATGFVVGLVSSFYAVKIRGRIVDKSQNVLVKNKFSFRDFFMKTSILSVVYMIFYFLFGYYVAWQFPVLREYYSGSTSMLSFGDHMLNQVNQDPMLIVFQIFRGALWALIGYIVLVGLSTKEKIEKYIIVGLILSVGLSTPLFVPNEYMPSGVRFGHFFELLIENFLFGVLLTYVYTYKQAFLNKQSSITNN
jgi:hypothetical protein